MEKGDQSDKGSDIERKFDIFSVLKKLEPVGILITISLALAAITNDPGREIKSHEFSIISGVMFILCLIVGIADNYFKYIKTISSSSLLLLISGIVHFTFYFLLSVGIIFLLLYALEFIKIDPIASRILQNLFLIFIAVGSIQVLSSFIKEKNKRSSIKWKFLEITIAIFIIYWAFSSIVKIYELIEPTVQLLSHLDYFFIYIALFMGIIVWPSQMFVMLGDIVNWKHIPEKDKNIAIILLLSLIVLYCSTIIALSLYSYYGENYFQIVKTNQFDLFK